MLALPPLVFEKSCSIGKIRHQLLPAENVRVVNETRISISPRTKERLWSLSNGYRVLITDRAPVTLPDGVDGVLQVRKTKYIWKQHRLLNELEEKLTGHSISQLAEDAAMSWENQFSYRAERRNSEGEVIGGQEGLRPPQ